MVKARKYVLLKHFEGDPKRSDFEIVEEELPPLKDNEVLVEAEYISVDPYMRVVPQAYNMPVPNDMIGSQVARIVQSKHKDFSRGKRVVGEFGWRTHTIFNPDKPSSLPGAFGNAPYPVPDFGRLPSSLALGALGMPGNSAYFGFVGVCDPQPGEVVVVTGAAGAVGSIVGQIAKIKGCKVIGLAGSDDKCKWLKEELGFDAAINYKTDDIPAALKEAAPDGIDSFFDNVGGELASVIAKHLRYGARISLCGSISLYNATGEQAKVSPMYVSLMTNEASLHGFSIGGKRWANRLGEGTAQLLKWINEGKLKYNEHITEGFDNMFESFVGMLRGDNSGKAVVKI